MDPQYQFATREEFWRLQDDMKDIYNTQLQQSERIMRLEKRREEENRVKSVWNGPASPFPTALGAVVQQESTYNPAAEAFRNFDTDPGLGHLSLDNDDERRRGTSRANSVRFDESAINHYGSSRQSMDLPPARTGSGLGSHPMSERSLSHRSDGKGSASGLSARANSFVLESQRLAGSSAGSPRITGSINPPPGFLFLGPCPSIIRCWISDNFSNDSLLYAAVCTGSYSSTISEAVLQKAGLRDEIIEEGNSRKIKLPLYLTEATIQQSSSRSGSPVPQVPVLSVKLLVTESDESDKTIQIILGSDVLRSRNADVLFSQERLLIFDDDRNKLAIPLVRPENEAVYKTLVTSSALLSSSSFGDSGRTPTRIRTDENPRPGIIGRPSKLSTAENAPATNIVASPAVMNSSSASEQGDRKTDQDTDGSARTSLDLNRARNEEPSKVPESEKNITPSKTSNASGVWGSSWRTNPSTQPDGKTASNYARATQGRSMKVLRPGKSMANSSRTVSASVASTNGSSASESTPMRSDEMPRRASLVGESKPIPKSIEPNATPTSTVPSKANPIGQASAFGWLNPAQQQRRTAAGSD
ncbi:MAG: hypothetical protein Q9227_008698 [Pyrenula ochraceoflavens]